MFFSPELLAKRDSGFGLLWLAATLGSKSSFKKLPRRSIQTADIPQLCDLISHPSEPLALRLSSNLMVGVARVYKIKHEIFVTDISNCFAHLKKAVQEIHALGTLSEAQLQMGQPTVRPDALTLTADPSIAVAFEFDAFADWADISGFGTQRQNSGMNECDDEDDEFTPGGNKAKAKAKGKSKTSLMPSETARANLHTLDEHHEHLLSTSFDANASFLGAIGASSSQMDTALRFGSFGFDDNVFGPGDNFDMALGDIGDELARELGEGWGADIPSTALGAPMDVDQQPNFDIGGDFDLGLDQNFDYTNRPITDGSTGKDASTKKRPFAESDKENLPPAISERLGLTPRSVTTHHSQVSAPRSFVEELIANDNQIDLTELVEGQNITDPRPQRKPRRARLLFDARTELSDEELKAARDNYVERQRLLRLEMERKRLEKEGGKALEDLIWGTPEGLTAPALTNFWFDIYRVQVESRSGNIHLDEHDGRYTKRQRRVSPGSEVRRSVEDKPEDQYGFGNNDYAPMDYDFGFMDGDFNAPVNFDDVTRLRSSEEPERGRDGGQHKSSHLGFDAAEFNPSSGTQRSAFFPWDHAAGASSSAGGGFAPVREKSSDRVSLDNADVRIMRSRSRSGSRRGSFSIVPSHSGSIVGLNFGMSPTAQRGSDDFQFDVTHDGITAQDTQEAENIITIERTSFNFLEYCKMQAQALSSGQNTLGFDDIVPYETSSRRVAAAAFHHCLALATKDLITVNQDIAYGPLKIRIK